MGDAAIRRRSAALTGRACFTSRRYARLSLSQEAQMVDRDPLPAIHAKVGDADFERILDIQQAMLTAAAFDRRRDDIDPAHHTAMTIAAGGLLAGYLFGATIGAGIARDADKKRAGAMILTNFRQGIRIGKDQALMSMTEGASEQ